MFRALGFSELLWVSFRVRLVTCQDASLRPKYALHYVFRRVPGGQFHLIPRDLEVAVLGSPAKEALLRTVEQGRGHLDALMRLNAIEFLFVARPTIG